MYAYKMNNNPNGSGSNNTVHHPHRFEFVIKRIEMDPIMLTATFTVKVDGVMVKFQGLLKSEPTVMAAVMAQEFHSWHFSNRNRKTIPEFKQFMERFVSGLAIVNEQ